MSDESASSEIKEEAPGAASTPPTLARKFIGQPWISRLAIAASIGVFLGILTDSAGESWENYSKWGYLPAGSIREGDYWALLTSVFVHMDPAHLIFNAYWLWALGGRMERSIGSLRFLAFFTLAGLVSSAFQFAVSDDTGIGASGVVYAIFGFMWLARGRYPEFGKVLDRRTIGIFLLWLAGCIVASYLDLLNVGNAAHVSGLLFGGAVAGVFVVGRKTAFWRAGLAALMMLPIAPFFWCPWSVSWLSLEAFAAHDAGETQRAIDLYTRILEIEPEDAWARYSRGVAYGDLGDEAKAQADIEKARQIDPTIEDAE